MRESLRSPTLVSIYYLKDIIALTLLSETFCLQVSLVLAAVLIDYGNCYRELSTFPKNLAGPEFCRVVKIR